jgi:predicted transcriptional regulator YdeE
MLQDHIATYKKREKEINAKAYMAKKQIKENFFVVQSVITKMKDFDNSVNNIYGEMLGIQDKVDKQRKRLENDNK